MKKFVNKTLVDFIYENVEKHLSGLLKIGLEVHQTPVTDAKKMKKMLQQKAINLTYVFNAMLLSELPVVNKRSIKNANTHLYVNNENLNLQQNNNQSYCNMSLMDELLLRLERKDHPVRIVPFKEKAEYANNNRKKIMLANDSFEEKLLVFLEKINEVKNLTELHKFERQYHSFVHDFLNKSKDIDHQQLLKKHLDKYHNDEEEFKNKDLVHSCLSRVIYHQILNKQENIELNNSVFSSSASFSGSSYVVHCHFYEFCGFLSNLNHIDKTYWYFGRTDSLLQSNVEFDYDFIKNSFLGSRYLKDIFPKHDLNLIHGKLLFDFFNKKYKWEFEKYTTKSDFNFCFSDEIKLVEKEKYNELVSYTKNAKIIYKQNLLNYSDYCDFYEQNETAMMTEGINKLSSDDYHDIYQTEKINEYLDILKKCHQHLKKVYEYEKHNIDANFYPFYLNDEETMLFEKVKKQLFNDFPELNLTLEQFSNTNVKEQEVGVILHEKLPFSTQNMITRKAIIENKGRIFNNTGQTYDNYDDLLNFSNLAKTKLFQSSCDFYFPYLSKDKGLDIDFVAYALKAYNKTAFTFTFNNLYDYDSPNFEFYVKNNGIKQFQLCAKLFFQNPCYLSVSTSCSNQNGFSQVAYDAMVDFAYQNNLFVCRNLSEMSTQGQERLINKLNKAQEKYPDALLIDYYENGNEVGSCIFAKNFDNVFDKMKNIYEEYEKDDVLQMKKMNEFLFKMADEYIEKEQTFLKLHYNRIFFNEVIENLPDVYDLNLENHVFLNKGQYQEIKKIYDECLTAYLKSFRYAHEEKITLLSHANEIMFKDENDEWQVDEEEFDDELSLCDDDFIFEYHPFDKLNKFQDFYLYDIIEKVGTSISYDIQERLEMLEKEKVENKNTIKNKFTA